MDYNHIEKFLERFKTILFKKEEHNRVISEIITKHTSATIDPKSIKIIGSIIQIKKSPMLFSEILIKKNAILLDLKELIPDRSFKDIR